jgi:hypothetical protein
MTTAGDDMRIDYNPNAPASVPDMAPPVLTVPSSFAVEATSAAGAVVTFAATGVDATDGVRPVACSATSGNRFPIGSTTIRCSTSDLSGNVAERSFTVTVRDTTAPRLTLPSPIVVLASWSVSVGYAASADDIVSGSRPVTCVPVSGSSFKVGITSVTCSATDVAGNTATGSFTVTVKKK